MQNGKGVQAYVIFVYTGKTTTTHLSPNMCGYRGQNERHTKVHQFKNE